jgi:hypothetical protein
MHKFEGFPRGVPMGRGLTGNFCSWACAMAWSEERGGVRVGERHSALRLLMKSQCGIPMSQACPRAPPREALLALGGHLSIEAFRAAAGVQMLQRPMVGMVPNEFEMLVGAGFEMRRPYVVGGKQQRYTRQLAIKG